MSAVRSVLSSAALPNSCRLMPMDSFMECIHFIFGTPLFLSGRYLLCLWFSVSLFSVAQTGSFCDLAPARKHCAFADAVPQIVESPPLLLTVKGTNLPVSLMKFQACTQVTTMQKQDIEHFQHPHRLSLVLSQLILSSDVTTVLSSVAIDQFCLFLNFM